MVSPTQRSLTLLRSDGWTCAITEHWNHFAKIRQDLFGFADVLAMKPNHTPRLIQITSGSNVSARVKKIRTIEKSYIALDSGFDIYVHGWRKLKSTGWTPRVLLVLPDSEQEIGPPFT